MKDLFDILGVEFSGDLEKAKESKPLKQTIEIGHQITASDGTEGTVIENDGKMMKIEFVRDGKKQTLEMDSSGIEKKKIDGSLQHNSKPSTLKDHHKKTLEEAYIDGKPISNLLSQAKGMGVDESEAFEHISELSKKSPRKSELEQQKEKDKLKEKEKKSIKKSFESEEFLQKNKRILNSFNKSNKPPFIRKATLETHHYISKNRSSNGSWEYDYTPHSVTSRLNNSTDPLEQNYLQNISNSQSSTILNGKKQITSLLSQYDSTKQMLSGKDEELKSLDGTAYTIHESRRQHCANDHDDIANQIIELHSNILDSLSKHKHSEK